MGRQSSIGENAKTHLLTAEMLGWPCVTQVIRVDLVDDKHLMVTSQVDDGWLRQQIQIPCVLSIGDAPNTFLRVPTLKDRMVYGRRPIEILSGKGIELSEETERLVHLEVCRRERSTVLIDGQSPEEKARILYENHLKNSVSMAEGLGEY